MKKYLITGIAEVCGLCLPEDGRKAANKPVFQIQCEGGAGGFSGPCCAQHVALLLKMDEPKKPQAEVAKPAAPVTANALVK